MSKVERLVTTLVQVHEDELLDWPAQLLWHAWWILLQNAPVEFHPVGIDFEYLLVSCRLIWIH